MSIKLTERQFAILINAINSRVVEINDILNPLMKELAEHKEFLTRHHKNRVTQISNAETIQSFELLPWSKKISRILQETKKFMSTYEIVTEIVNRIPGLASEPSTRSSVASILSRRSGKLFQKMGDKYGLIEWEKGKE